MMRFVKENLEANLAGLKANITNDMGRNSEAVMLTVSTKLTFDGSALGFADGQ